MQKRNNKGYTKERPLQLIQDLKIKTVSNKINRALTETGKHAKANEWTYDRKAKLEARDRIIGVHLQNDNELWTVSHKGTILKLILTLIGGSVLEFV